MSRNKTLKIENIYDEKDNLFEEFLAKDNEFENKVINGDTFSQLKSLPNNFVDLLVVDPPYNLTKEYDGTKFNRTNDNEYIKWLEKWVKELPRIMKPNGTLYFCGDWKTSPLYYQVLSKYFYIKNRITWEREKGRGSDRNWKNNIEDIYFCTMDDKDYVFNINSVKVKKRVIAPYKDEEGKAKDWFYENGEKFRFTHPANVWTDITVPYWSMPENTEHPTQKPEKLIAKLILASSNEGDMVFDPFLGSGTTAVVAKKLNRRFCGIEREEGYCLLAAKRLKNADNDNSIQGYKDGMFLTRNYKINKEEE